MSQNDGYSNNRRRNQRKNERTRNDRNTRNGVDRKSIKEEQHLSKNERKTRERESKRKVQRELSPKNQRNSQQREFQNEMIRMIQKGIAENDAAIRSFKSTSKICELCGQPISSVELGSAISNRGSANPAHFDCVLKQLSEEEQTGVNERLTYIGQGKFAVLHFENPNDLKHFTIRRTIEWEKTEERLDWRNEMAGLFSQII